MGDRDKIKIGKRAKSTYISQMAKAPTEIKSLARSHTETAIRTLAAIMKQKNAPAAARISAACALLDRGWGKPDKNIDETMSADDVFLQFLKQRNGIVD